ncbi:MAG: hypothetical protein VB070_10185 [Clostridiaceae bacterium]|nr:hypothetical protein [Clostridiaceae bacterium]
MDWSRQINHFTSITRDDVPAFAPSREMEQAIGIYNKALYNLDHESQDIALIALRKLVSSYPGFPQPAFLLGCLQAQAGLTEEAADMVGQAVSAGLPDDMQQDALFCQSELLEQQERINRQSEINGGHGGHAGHLNHEREMQNETERLTAARLPVQAAGVLEKSRRRKKVKIASERERQDVLRRSEFPEEEETRVVMHREPVEYLRIILPIIAGGLLLITLIIAGIRWLPQTGWFQGSTQKTADVRLEWLMTRLRSLSGNDAAVADLMNEYQAQFEPSPTPAALPTESQTAAVPSGTAASPSPAETSEPDETGAGTTATTLVETTAVPTATVDAAVQSLLAAADHYNQAVDLKDSDIMAAADHLLAARELLAGIPASTTAESVSGDAAATSQAVETLIGDIAVKAAEQNRLKGQNAFSSEDYTTALSYYLKAYQIYPRAYGGGVAYYCGRCNQLLGNKEEAKKYYDFVIAEFGGRDIAGNAERRLKEMGY